MWGGNGAGGSLAKLFPTNQGTWHEKLSVSKNREGNRDCHLAAKACTEEGPKLPNLLSPSHICPQRCPHTSTLTLHLALQLLLIHRQLHDPAHRLSCISMEPYLQIPGDGRELVVVHPSACKIRAEDGRRVEAVNISPFISNLPYGESTWLLLPGFHS